VTGKAATEFTGLAREGAQPVGASAAALQWTQGAMFQTAVIHDGSGALTCPGGHTVGGHRPWIVL
jgi:hypothetical protein